MLDQSRSSRRENQWKIFEYNFSLYHTEKKTNFIESNHTKNQRKLVAKIISQPILIQEKTPVLIHQSILLLFVNLTLTLSYIPGGGVLSGKVGTGMCGPYRVLFRPLRFSNGPFFI